MKITRKKMYKKCIVVLVCLSIAGNLAHGTVLCFGADGHTELESAFHERCDDPVHSYALDQSPLSSEGEHEICKHCGPCVDIPISIGLAKISPVTKQLNPTFLVSAANTIALADKFDLSAYNSISDTFVDTSFFTPLRTVIMLA